MKFMIDIWREIDKAYVYPTCVLNDYPVFPYVLSGEMVPLVRSLKAVVPND
jgi:hypothetical protein